MQMDITFSKIWLATASYSFAGNGYRVATGKGGSYRAWKGLDPQFLTTTSRPLQQVSPTIRQRAFDYGRLRCFQGLICSL